MRSMFVNRARNWVSGLCVAAVLVLSASSASAIPKTLAGAGCYGGDRSHNAAWRTPWGLGCLGCSCALGAQGLRRGCVPIRAQRAPIRPPKPVSK